jgi:hypothetical protein
MLGMIAALGAASFAVNLWLTEVRPSAAFFLPAGRFWELLVGSALAWFSIHRVPEGRSSNSKAWIGLLLVAAGFALLNAARDFPGWWALLPVLGTALLVAAGPQAWLNRRLLAHPALVFVGLISYPLYLWHWPLLSYARIVQGGEPSVALRVALLAASFALAWATYEFLEKRIRFARAGTPMRRAAVPALAASMSAIGVFGFAALQGRVAPQSAAVPLVAEISRASLDWESVAERVIPGDSPQAVLFLGDSHMQHYWPRIEKLVAERAAPLRTVIFKTAGGCAPVPGIERRGMRCASFVDEGFELARSAEVDTVVIAASWVGFVNRPDYVKAGDDDGAPLRLLTPGTEWVLQGFESALRDLVRRGKRVVLVLSSPRGAGFDPKSVIRREGMTVQVRSRLTPVPRTEVEALTAAVDARLRALATAAGATVVDPADWLCSAAWCPTADDAGRPLYKDATHLRASAARERFGAVDRYVYVR